MHISKKVYFKFLAELFRISLEGCRQEVVTFHVEQMPDAGKAKVCLLGAGLYEKFSRSQGDLFKVAFTQKTKRP